MNDKSQTAWLVIRSEKHVDDKYWVSTGLDDALDIAADVTRYWLTEYDDVIKANGGLDEVVDKTCYGDLEYHCDAEDLFRVAVQPVKIRNV